MNTKSTKIQYGYWINFNYKLQPANTDNDWEFIDGKRIWFLNCYFPKVEILK